MWLKRFFQIIDDSPVGAFVEKRRKLLEYTGEPNRIYVENVRSFFGVSTFVAKALCDLAVRRGLFERCSGILCPHDERILFESCDPDSALPETVTCSVCEALEIEPNAFSARECRELSFYRVRHAQ